MTFQIYRTVDESEPLLISVNIIEPIKVSPVLDESGEPTGAYVEDENGRPNGRYRDTGRKIVHDAFSGGRLYACAPEGMTADDVIARVRAETGDNGWAITRGCNPSGEGNPTPCDNKAKGKHKTHKHWYLERA